MLDKRGKDMSKLPIVALTIAFVIAPVSARAGDGDKEKKVRKEEKVRVDKKSDKSESGRGFTGFWVHTVGGTIGNGLKSGASKISKTFD